MAVPWLNKLSPMNAFYSHTQFHLHGYLISCDGFHFLSLSFLQRTHFFFIASEISRDPHSPSGIYEIARSSYPLPVFAVLLLYCSNVLHVTVHFMVGWNLRMPYWFKKQTKKLSFNTNPPQTLSKNLRRNTCEFILWAYITLIPKPKTL